ncbi:MAG: TlpA family protein disulfide reductase [Actinocrinis sp.]
MAVGVTRYVPAARAAVPTMAGTTLDGGKLALSDYVGLVVVVNVWGSWCAKCRLEEPALEETYRAYQAAGVRFLGINDHDDNAAALAYTRAFGMTYPSLQDPDETLLLQLHTMIPATSIPSSVIVDRHGRIAARVIGPITEPRLRQLLDAVLAEKA